MTPGGGHRFWDWFACPECDERDSISTLAYATDIVIECYECGRIDEYVIGKDVSLAGLDITAIQQIAKESDD